MNTCKSPSPWQIWNGFESPSDPDEEREIWLESDGLDEKSQIIMHDYSFPTAVEFQCAHDACNKIFWVVLYPEQYIYPSCCEKHSREQKLACSNRF